MEEGREHEGQAGSCALLQKGQEAPHERPQTEIKVVNVCVKISKMKNTSYQTFVMNYQTGSRVVERKNVTFKVKEIRRELRHNNQ